MEENKERETIVEKYEHGREKVIKEQGIDPWEDPQFELYHVTDRYGFIHDYRLPEKHTDHENKIRSQESLRLSKWVKMRNSWDIYFPNSDKLRKRIYKGIPNALRGDVWSRILGIHRIKLEQDGKYSEMLSWGLKHSPDIRQIDLDVNRTYRNHIMFRERYNNKQQMLFRLLVAYSVYNSEVGYCQGMSQIAALLLMYMDEEDAFWALSVLMSDEKHAMHGFFIPGFPKLVRFARHHDRVIQKHLPKLAKLLKKYDIDSTLYTLKWFFQCFLDRVPFSLTLRLWDCFMYDGEIILTGMSYTLLKLHKRSLLRKGMEQLIEFLQIELEKDFGYHDDEAINALHQSIQELKRHGMLYPAEGPSLNELPSRPFGLLTPLDNSDNSSLFNDNQSIVGSIILKPSDSVSLAQTSRTESEIGDDACAAIDSIDIQNDENSDQNSFTNGTLRRSLSLYDNVDVHESIEAAHRLSGVENVVINANSSHATFIEHTDNDKCSNEINHQNKTADATNERIDKNIQTLNHSDCEKDADDINNFKTENIYYHHNVHHHNHDEQSLEIKQYKNNNIKVNEKFVEESYEQNVLQNKQLNDSHSKSKETNVFELSSKISSKMSSLNSNSLNSGDFVQEWPDSGINHLKGNFNNERLSPITSIVANVSSPKETSIVPNVFPSNPINNSDHNNMPNEVTTKSSFASDGSVHSISHVSVESQRSTILGEESAIGNRKSPLRTPWKRGSEKRQGMVMVSPTSPSSPSPTSPISSPPSSSSERPSLIPRYVAKNHGSVGNSSASNNNKSVFRYDGNSHIKPLSKYVSDNNSFESRNNKSTDDSKVRIYVPFQYEEKHNQFESNKIKIRVDTPIKHKDSKSLPKVDT